ncbi:ORC1-type DNA replication protein [Thermococcus sp. Bubb.Bath]|uniref:ORC1-type DNA replication protein n=1 Tax=Thermococcus sp. Bubb.Bath TaxID=1638242 RepID=UPI00143B6835|nr:ORC1-type DNA replication protein [Thermococcus sp. Bubb.Bath]NJF25058.1 ORC1-type DNA replication protein [Thermococcus sp. Bubb.Bath]
MNDYLGSIFERYLHAKKIFKNKEVLRHSYTPKELPHRKEQIEELAHILVPVLRGETPSNVFVYGKTGTGKTVTIKFVTEELKRISEKYQVPVEVIYINCEIVDTQYRVLANIVNYFKEESGVEVPLVGWPTDEVYARLREVIDARERFVIIVLDEIDKLIKKSGDDILYSLTRINTELGKAKVSIIGISNDLKFKEYLDARVLSSLSEEEVVFPPYDANQLRDILMQRARDAFNEGVLDDAVVPLCAALAAREHGDARRALDLLRVAGEIAEREGASKVTEHHVRLAQDKIEQDTMEEVIKTLPLHSKILLYSVVLLDENGELPANTGDVYSVYKKICDYLDIEPLTQRRVSDLINELDMLGIINAKVVSKGRYGRTKEIRLNVTPHKVKKIFGADDQLRPLLTLNLSGQRRLV